MGLLQELFSTQSSSGNYDRMHKVIMDKLVKIGSLNVNTDSLGNIYVTKGTPPEGEFYPTFACHTDTVHDFREGYKVGRSPGHVWYAYYTTPMGEIRQTGIGGDDKCGIYLCLRMLKALPYVKCIFFVDEEVGCRGSLGCDMTFFNDSRWVVQGDRKHNCDIIVSGLGEDLCSKEFSDAVVRLGGKYGYSISPGVWTDVVKLKKDRELAVSAINISVGYWSPHSSTEIVVESDLNKAVHFCEDIARKLTGKYYHKIEKKPWLLSSGRVCMSTGCKNILKVDETRLCSACNVQTFINRRKLLKCVDCGIQLFTDEELARVRCGRCLHAPLH